MPSENVPSLIERVQSSYQKLTEVAINLNAASDDLGHVIHALEEALKKLNLGITSWYEYAGHQNEGGSYWGRHIGYAKVGTKWGIAISRTSGHEAIDETHNEEWLFNEAPRHLRIEAIEYIPEMIDKLIADAEKAVERIRTKTAEAKQLAEAITPKKSLFQRKLEDALRGTER